MVTFEPTEFFIAEQPDLEHDSLVVVSSQKFPKNCNPIKITRDPLDELIYYVDCHSGDRKSLLKIDISSID